MAAKGDILGKSLNAFNLSEKIKRSGPISGKKMTVKSLIKEIDKRLREIVR